MKLDDILATINNVSYENVDEVIIPTKDLVTLRREVINLQESLRQSKAAHREATAVGMRLMAEQMEDTVAHFDEYM